MTYKDEKIYFETGHIYKTFNFEEGSHLSEYMGNFAGDGKD